MAGLGDRIWYGSAHAQEGGGESDAHGQLWLLAVAVALVGLRLVLPFTAHETTHLYEQVVWALLHEQNWGRQALVAVLEYPPLPAVGVLMATPVAGLLHVPAAHLVVAVCEVWCLTYLVRLAGLYRSRRLRYVLGPVLLAAMLVGPGALQDNLFWTEAVVMCSIIFHLCRWQQDESLRDLVVVALNCGMLVFCGLMGLLFCAGILGTIWCFGSGKVVRAKGGATLMLLPTLYALLLYPLFNWLVMGDFLFWIRRSLEMLNGPRVVMLLGQMHGPELWVLVAMAMTCVSLFWAKWVPLYTRVALHLGLLAGCARAVAKRSECYLGGEAMLLATLAVALVVFMLYHEQSGVRRLRQTLLLMGASLGFFAACAHFRATTTLSDMSHDVATVPSPQEVVQLVDLYWERSRILVYDLRTAALFASAVPDRVWARLDFNEEYLRKQIKQEQFHLLLPPNNGRYYPRNSGPLASIHERGRRWLFLEKEWPSGWQLWRCIRPLPEPEPESAPVPAAQAPTGH